MLPVEQDEQKLAPNKAHNSDIRITFPLRYRVIHSVERVTACESSARVLTSYNLGVIVYTRKYHGVIILTSKRHYLATS
jgi:hypothetical protein